MSGTSSTSFSGPWRERPQRPECYLAVGANLAYSEVIRMIGRAAARSPSPSRPGAAGRVAGGWSKGERRGLKSGPLITFGLRPFERLDSYYDPTRVAANSDTNTFPSRQTVADGWVFPGYSAAGSTLKSKKRHGKWGNLGAHGNTEDKISRVLGFWDIVGIVVGGVIGSGIFLVP